MYLRWHQRDLPFFQFAYPLFEALNKPMTSVNQDSRETSDATIGNLRDRVRCTVMSLFRKTARMLHRCTVTALGQHAVTLLLTPMAPRAGDFGTRRCGNARSTRHVNDEQSLWIRSLYLLFLTKYLMLVSAYLSSANTSPIQRTLKWQPRTPASRRS
jgi:hypothetical protein